MRFDQPSEGAGSKKVSSRCGVSGQSAVACVAADVQPPTRPMQIATTRATAFIARDHLGRAHGPCRGGGAVAKGAYDGPSAAPEPARPARRSVWLGHLLQETLMARTLGALLAAGLFAGCGVTDAYYPQRSLGAAP